MAFRQEVIITAHDANIFLSLVEEMVSKGGKVLKGYPFLSLPYTASFEFINKEHIPARPGVQDLGRKVMADAVAVANYTKEQLEEMDWDAFRAVCKVFDIKGRERDVMVEKYLKAQAEGK